jgi:hypothetical protein
MHEIVIALIFVGMVACPAVLAAMPGNEMPGNKVKNRG